MIKKLQSCLESMRGQILARRKIKEDEKLVAVNNSIKSYGGLYANWKSGGCQDPMPQELLDRLIRLSETLDTYMKAFKLDVEIK